jgi:hypothetical protein
MADKLAAEEKECGGNDYYEDHEYGHDCRVAATTVIRHKSISPSCTGDSLFVGDVIVFGDRFQSG